MFTFGLVKVSSCWFGPTTACWDQRNTHTHTKCSFPKLWKIDSRMTTWLNLLTLLRPHLLWQDRNGKGRQISLWRDIWERSYQLKFQKKNAGRLKMDEIVTDRGREKSPQWKTRGSTQRTVKPQHDKDKEKSLKGILGGGWAGFGRQWVANEDITVRGFWLTTLGA